ncbi:MAG: O-antigen/teichoic acid export membrane protein [Vicingaceae bacterium]|jgi:O-antigen/teichoic acid export membrane protein
MGIIIRQAAYSSVFSYVGVALGFLNVAIFMNRWLTPEELGLRNILLDIAIIYAQFANFGMYKGMVKFFPFFRANDNSDRGLLSIASLTAIAGFLTLAIPLFLFQDQILDFYASESSMIKNYYFAIFPLSFFLIFVGLLESYLQARSETVISSFVKNVLHRCLLTIFIVLLHLEYIDYYQFLALFVGSYALVVLFYFVYLWVKGYLSFKIHFDFFSRRLRGVFYNYSFFSVMSNFSSIVVTRVDVLMIGYFLGLEAVAIYTNAFFLTVLLMVPSVSMANITLPLLSNSWKDRNIEKIDEIYKKTSLTQFLMGGAIFILMWSSIDNFFELQRPEYIAGKWVFFFLGLSKVINLIFGVNHQIINITKYYRFDSFSSLVLALMTIISNTIMIKAMGILGAAIATAVSLVLFNLIRSYFLYKKLRIQPFTFKSVTLFLILLGAFIIGEMIPFIENIYIDTAFRSVVIFAFILFLTVRLNISEEINSIYNRMLNHVKGK